MRKLAISRSAAIRNATLWIGFILLVVAWPLVSSAAGAGTDHNVQVLRNAEAAIRFTHCTTESELDANNGVDAGLTPIQLPHYWDRAFPGKDGRITYRLTFHNVPSGHDSPAFYLARAANSFEMRLNGKLLASSGDLCAPAPYGGQRPLYVPVPEAMLQADNTLDITIAALANARGGLSPVEFGPGSTMRARYEGALWFRVIGPLVIAAVSLVLAGISLLIWWRQRDPLFGLYALAEIAWAVSLAEFFLTDAPLPRGVWQVIILSGRAVFMVATARFALIIIDVRARWPVRLVNTYLWLKLPLIVLMASVLSVPLLKMADWAINVVMACIVGSALVWSTLRRPNRERIALATAVGLSTALTSADIVRITMIGDFYWETALTKYVSLLFSLAMAWLLAERYTRTSRKLAELNRDLDQKVAQKEIELHKLYAHSREIEREQAALRERGRIMRDMHDGLGSTLVGALSLLRSGQGSPLALQQHLQQALDTLKFSVDALQDTGGDLAAVLGNLRYRLRDRLLAAGLTVDWQVERLPPVAGLTPQIVRELQYILLEAFSNAMQHADGGVLQVVGRSLGEPSAEARTLLIEVRDSGPGFDIATVAHGHGLANMRARAAAIGGELSIESSTEGTVVRLLLPPLM
ncbi:sensor histidine kinase [Ralstonia pickettii]|uniref:sensor histidine kinase n=1 Tax=Ralstonia pickettii TaxID=329 RepID=UPI000468C009|nr:ATP-binding protein [Ralstonia pickettii]